MSSVKPDLVYSPILNLIFQAIKASNLIIAIRTCDEKRVVLPKLVIYEPDEVPILSGEVIATLTLQVNELHSTVEDLIDHLSFFRSAQNKASVTLGAKATNSPDAAKPSYSVILKQPPKGLKRPNSQKEYLGPFW